MTETLRPFTMTPVLSPRPWGGRRLEEYGKELPEGVLVGESWEVADLPDHVAPTIEDPRSRVSSGPFAGQCLADLIASNGDELLGPIAPTDEGRFPLLVKLLDAREHLSVQVHPHQHYVAEHPEARLKTESWYVVEAEPDAAMFYGFEEGLSRNEVVSAIGTPHIVPALHTMYPEPGSFHNVPAGLVHSLGAGLMVAEIQTPSDTTYRLYDWAVEYGREPRPLHAEQGAASILLNPAFAYSLPPAPGRGARELISNRHYWIREHRTNDTIVLAKRRGPRIMMVIRGSLEVEDLSLRQGGTAIIPAAALGSPVTARGPSTVLEIGLQG